MRQTLAAAVLAALFLAGCAGHHLQVEGKRVKLYLRAPAAREVLFASSLDGYRPHPACREGRSRWVVSMPSGKKFSYFYLVDGNVLVPECPCREQDGFGSENCVYAPEL